MEMDEPTTLEGALIIIEELQRKLRCYEKEFNLYIGKPPGMRPQSWRLYQFMKSKGFASHGMIKEFLWGKYPKHGNNVSVAISHIRDFLPAGEEILPVRGSGFVWQKREVETAPPLKPIIVLATQKDWAEYAAVNKLNQFDRRYIVLSSITTAYRIKGIEAAQLIHVSPVRKELKELASAMVRP